MPDQDIRGVAALVASRDWAQTPFGPQSSWSPVLSSTVDMVLGHGFPMVLLWGPDLLQIYNDGYRIIMGDKHPSGLGQPTRECWPEVWHINRPIYGRVWSGETLTFEDKLFPITRHGPLEDAWFTLTYSPVREDGRLAGILVTVFETTAQHRAATQREVAEQAVRESEQQFRALATAGTNMIYRMSPDWRFMFQLDGRGVLADTPEPIDGWVDRYIPLEDRERVHTAIHEAIARKAPFELEHHVLQADGAVGWVFSRAIPILDGQGEIREWLGAGVDITARKAAEGHLHEGEKRQAFLLGLSDALRTLNDPRAIAAQATFLPGEHLQADRVFITEVAADGVTLNVRDEYLRAGASSILGQYSFGQFGAFIGRELHRGHVVAVEDVATLRDLNATERAAYADVGVGAYLLVPLIRNGRLAAHLTVNHRRPRLWSPADQAVAQHTADRTWTAMEHARAETALRESEALRRVALAGGRMGTWRWDLAKRLVYGDARPLLTQEFLDEVPNLRATLQAFAEGDERRALNQIMRLGRLTALERLAHLLLEIRERLQVIGEAPADRMPLPLTQEVLADLTGLSVVHVNRTLQELRRRDLALVERGTFQLPNLPQLKEIAAYESRSSANPYQD